jgi:hypothetical protein
MELLCLGWLQAIRGFSERATTVLRDAGSAAASTLRANGMMPPAPHTTVTTQVDEALIQLLVALETSCAPWINVDDTGTELGTDSVAEPDSDDSGADDGTGPSPPPPPPARAPMPNFVRLVGANWAVTVVPVTRGVVVRPTTTTAAAAGGAGDADAGDEESKG